MHTNTWTTEFLSTQFEAQKTTNIKQVEIFSMKKQAYVDNLVHI